MVESLGLIKLNASQERRKFLCKQKMKENIRFFFVSEPKKLYEYFFFYENIKKSGHVIVDLPLNIFKNRSTK